MDDLIGLIPAAGTASRLPALPCSKEIFPIGFQSVEPGEPRRPKAACEYLIDRMRAAGLNKVYVILRMGKWDIPSFLKGGQDLGVSISYLIMHKPFGVPYTLDCAYPFIKNKRIMFGFPDIIFQPHNAFTRILAHQASDNADVVLGLFPTRYPEKEEIWLY